MIKDNQKVFNRLHVFMDVMITVVSYALAYFIKFYIIDAEITDVGVLVVDDNKINRRVATGFLKPYKMELTEAESGPEAIALVKENAFDMILMDHMMPGMDGIEAVRIIRRECGENGKNAIIIAATANAMEGVKEHFLEIGFQDFIPKPIDKKHLYLTLAKWIPEEKRKAPSAQEEQSGSEHAPAEFSVNEPLGGRPDRTEPESLEEIVIEGIDAAAAMQHQSGSLDDYRELLQLYCLEGKRKLQLIKELFENQDYHDYEIEVHGLKSASANIGAMRLSAMAKEHEMAAGQSDADFVLAHFSELYEAYEEQLTHIQDYLDKAVQEDEEPEAEELPKEELLRQIGEALLRLQKFRSHECADILTELLRHRLPQDVKEQLSEIQEQLKLYEDDAAEQLLQQMLQKMESQR